MNTVYLICLFASVVYGYEDFIEKKQEGSAGVPNGDYLVQRITTHTASISELFWRDSEKTLYYTDDLTDNLLIWNYYGELDASRVYIEEIKGEHFAFTVPLLNDKNRHLIGSNRYIRMLTLNGKTVVNVSEPLITFPEKGYRLKVAHCDKNGVMYVVLNYINAYSKPAKGSILYKIKNRRMEKVHESTQIIPDFVFSFKNDKMYIITDGGKTITVFNYNLNTGEITNPEKMFTLDNHFSGVMKSIEIDVDNNLWVAVEDKVMRISQESKVTKIIVMPAREVSSITFGGYKNKNILVGTSKYCHRQDIVGGSIFAITGLTTYSLPDSEVRW